MKNYKILDWDSVFFGYKVVRIENPDLSPVQLKDILKNLKKEEVKLAYYFANPLDLSANKAAAENKGLLVDKKITLSLNKIPHTKKSSIVVSFIGKPVNDQILNLALQAGIYSRFRLDPNFKKDDWERMYKTWIERSLSKEIADEVLVCIDGDREVGLITIKGDGERGEIGLLSVDKNHRGKHIGTLLMNAVFNKSRELRLKSIKVSTQEENLPAMNFYAKLGFEIKESRNIYHFWL